MDQIPKVVLMQCACLCLSKCSRWLAQYFDAHVSSYEYVGAHAGVPGMLS